MLIEFVDLDSVDNAGVIVNPKGEMKGNNHLYLLLI
jgi:hypothetical protein